MRKQAVRLKKQGKGVTEIGRILGVRRQTVSTWWKRYQAIRAGGLKLAKRGIRKGTNRTLSADQELIRQKFDIAMPIRTLGEYLKRWGFTPQKPLKRAYEQRPSDVQHWLDEAYPAIARRAKVGGAEIHWGDETGLRSDAQHGRSYAPRGQTPAINLSAKRVSTNMISTVTNQGKVRFMLYQQGMNAQVLIKFLKRLIVDSERKVFLILDNLRVHHAKLVRQWLEVHKEEIEVFYLPAYSPKLNPDEYLNCDLKAGVHSRPPVRNKKQLQEAVISHMRKLQKLPARIVRYFKHPKIAYAAA